MSVTSFGGYLYFMIFVDDFSHKTWIFFLKKKGEAFDMFRDFKALIENQIGKLIKAFRSDNLGEFTSNDFNDLCKDAGIKKEITVPYNPQQNGVAERKNRTILEVVRAMLHDQKLSKFMWGDAANIAVYVQNRTPHQVLDNKTCKEVFNGKRPEVSHLRIFGCFVYFYVPKEKMNKLERLSKKYMFVGYCGNSKAYRIYVLGQRTIEFSGGVTFDEVATLRKARDSPPLAVAERQTVNEKESASESESEPENELAHNPMGSMDLLDPPPRDPPTRKRPLWPRDTLQDAAPRETFTKVRRQVGFKGMLLP